MAGPKYVLNANRKLIKEIVIKEEDLDKIFFSADQHFSHENIIKYTGRPFKDKEEMNLALLNNWNDLIGKGDNVYFLGDLAFKKEEKGIDYWYSQLNGNIIHIIGNHDHKLRDNGKDKFDVLRLYLPSRNLKLLLVHDYGKVEKCKDWIIHGHQHEKGKFFDLKNKRICVSVEQTNYAPIKILDILKLIENEK